MVKYKNKLYITKPEIKLAGCEGCAFYSPTFQKACINFTDKIFTRCESIIWKEYMIFKIFKSL